MTLEELDKLETLLKKLKASPNLHEYESSHVALTIEIVRDEIIIVGESNG